MLTFRGKEKWSSRWSNHFSTRHPILQTASLRSTVRPAAAEDPGRGRARTRLCHPKLAPVAVAPKIVTEQIQMNKAVFIARTLRATLRCPA